MEWQFDFARFEWTNGSGGDVFRKDVGVTIAIGAGGFFWFGWVSVAGFGRLGVGLLLRFGLFASGGRAFDGQFRLVRIVFAFRCHANFILERFSIKQAIIRAARTFGNRTDSQ
jgi:hypothetical protein